MDISRGTSPGYWEQQSNRRHEIYPSSNSFKENVLDKLLELKLLKFTEGTKTYLGNIPMKLNFDVKSTSINCCEKSGNDTVRGADNLTEKQSSSDKREVICNFNYYELHDGKEASNSIFKDRIPKVINVFPISCEKAFQSTEFTISQHEKITYICSNETECNIQPANELKFLNLETYSDFMGNIGNGLSTKPSRENMDLQHVNSEMTSSESVSNTFITVCFKDQFRIDFSNIHNESLIKHDSFVNLSELKLPDSCTVLMQLEYPCRFLVYSMLNQQERMEKGYQCFPEVGDKSKRKITNVKCKCREQKAACSCLHQKDKTYITNRYRSSIDGKTCRCIPLNRIISSDRKVVRKISKIHHLRKIKTNICGDTMLIRNEFLNETTNIKTYWPMREEMKLMNNQEKQSLTKSEDFVARKLQRREGGTNMQKTKRKCGCTRPYERGTALPVSAPPRSAQKKRFSCSCKISDKFTGLLETPNTRECGGKLKTKQSNWKRNLSNRKDKHLCDVCKLFHGIGDIMDTKESLISIEFSDVDKLISILDDVKNTGSKISTSIKRLKETDADSNDFYEYLLTCSTEGANKPNTIGIKIKYSDYETEDQMEHVKPDSCSCLGVNSNKTDTRKDIKYIFQKDCPCATYSMHGPQRCNRTEYVCESKKIYKTEENEEKEVYPKKLKATKNRRLSAERRISQGQVMPLIEVEFQSDVDVKNEVECIFKSKRACSYSSHSESTLATNIRTCNELKMKDQMLQKSCYRENCPKLVEPQIFPEKRDSGCLVEGSCIREKLLRTICVIPEFDASENAESLKPTLRDSQRRASNKTEKKEFPKKSPKKKTDYSKQTPGKPLLKKTNSKNVSPALPNKAPPKQKNKKNEESPPSVEKRPASKKKSKQKTSVSNTTVPKTKSKQKTSLSDTKVTARKKNSKQSKSTSDTKVPARKTNSKQSKSTSDTKVPARKTNSKKALPVNVAKGTAGKMNSKKGSSMSSTNKKQAQKINSKVKTSINTDGKPSMNSKPVKIPKKQTKSRKESSIFKQADTKQEIWELPVLRLNEVDQSMLSHALDVYLRTKGF